MPEFYRQRNWRIARYAADHLPPHFHVQSPEGEVQVAIDTLMPMTPIASKSASFRRIVCDALRWADRHQLDLLKERQRLNLR